MIARISNWSSGRELIRYLFGPGKVHDHIEYRVLASGIVMGVDEGRALSTGELANLGAALDADEDCWGTSPSGGHIWHLSLSLAQQEENVGVERRVGGGR